MRKIIALSLLSFIWLTFPPDESDAASRCYFHPAGDATQYTDAGFTCNNPTPDGFVKEEGTPPDGAQPYVKPTLESGLKGVFEGQPPAVRAQFYVYRAAVREALENKDRQAAKLIIQGVDVPPELEAAKQKLLDEFTKVGL